MQKRKGFTLVELVIVIAVIAILAGVLIGTFASVINRANASAEVQKTKSEEIAQKAEDILKKIEDSNWYGWEDFETSIVAKITQEIKNNGAGLTADQVKKIIEDALTTWQANKQAGNTELTAEQVKAIVENAVGTLHYEGVTEAQVRAIVTASEKTVLLNSITPVQIKQIVTAANEKNLTAAQVANIITHTSATATVTDVITALNNAVAGLATNVEIEKLRDDIKGLAVSETDDVVVAKALNIKLKKSGLTTTTAVHPTVVFETIQVTPTLKMGASAENDIMWDSANNSFVVVKLNGDKYVYSENAATETAVGDKYKLWKVVDSIDSACLYSQYLLVTTVSEPINVVAGLDVGKNTGITAINYSRPTGDAQTVVIRTNSSTTELNVNAPVDTVRHFGVAGVVDIISIAATSYHENGTVSLAKIKNGRLVVTEEAEIAGVHVVETNGNYNGIKIAVVGNAQLPSFTRDDVALETDQSKLVIEVQTLQQESTAPTAENTQYVWITGVGENEVSSSVSSSSTSATVAVTTESAAAQAVKTEARESTSAAELEQLEEAATRYAGGIGTEQKPYLIKNEAHLNSLREDVSAGETDGRYYKLIDNLVLDNFVMIGSTFTPDTSTGRGSYEINPVSTFKGILDGNNKIITYTLIINDIVTTNCGVGFFSNITDATIKNVTFNATLNCSASTAFTGGVTGFAFGDCNFENVTVNGNITAAWDVGGFIGATDDFGSGEFKNCVNNATIVANTLRTSGYSPTGGFIGQANALNSSGVLTFTNCQNNGSITVNQPQNKAATVSHFIGFVSDAHPETYNFNNCTVGQNASINVAFGQTRTKGNKTIYCAYTPSAEAIVPVIKYVGITNNTYDGGTAVAVINVDGQAQDLSRYVVE